MKRILNFVVILLTTLSIVNAVNIPLRKRAIAFAACPSGSPQFSAASIDPDPPVAGKTATAKFSITLPATFESGGKFAADATSDGGKAIDGFPTEQDICTLDGIKCPIAAGSTVDIQTPIKIPDDVPDTYTLEYSLVDSTGKEIACSSGPVTGAAKAKGGDDGKAPGGDGGDGGKGPGPGPDGAPPDGGDGGDGGPPKGPKGPDDGGKGPDGAPDGAPPDGGDGGDGGPPKGPKGPKGPDDGGKAPDGAPDGGPPGPPDGGDGGDGTPP